MNKLNVFGKHHYYLTWHPATWGRAIKTFVRSFKMAYQRVKYGYCDWDWFDLDQFYCRLMAASLRSLANKTISHPYDTPYEQWLARLRRLADRFEALEVDELDLIPYDIDKQKSAYFDCAQLYGEKRKQYIDDTMKELGEVWDSLWD